MTYGSAFRDVAAALDAIEEEGVEVVDVRPDEGEEGMAVDVEARAPVLDGIDAVPVEVGIEDAAVEDGSLTVDLSLRTPVEGEPEDRDDDGSTDDEEPEGVPPHRDPELLREAYEAHDTFPEMTEALGADVTPQSVRRQMISHGIHDPDTGGADADTGDGTDAEDTAGSADTGDDDGPAEPDDATDPEAEAAGDDGEGTALADGIDLPEGVRLEDLKAAVESGRTVHEVGRELGVERGLARRLLDELDLLDLVGGRLDGETRADREEIERRIAGAGPGGV